MNRYIFILYVLNTCDMADMEIVAMCIKKHWNFWRVNIIDYNKGLWKTASPLSCISFRRAALGYTHEAGVEASTLAFLNNILCFPFQLQSFLHTLEKYYIYEVN